MDEERKRRRPATEESMRLRLADLCARTEQCEADLRDKIRRAGLPADATERILTVLREQKFLDESRFACAYARDKARIAGWGTRKIRQGLAAKHISSSDISRALTSIDRREYIESFKRAALAKARSLDLADPADVQKLYRHLASRGFESSLISKGISSLKASIRDSQGQD